jgi:hypothetical protein
MRTPTRHVRSVVTGLVVAVSSALLPAVLRAQGAGVFVSSASGPGNLMSWPEANMVGTPSDVLDAGDRVCRYVAGQAGVANASKYRAWLSTSTTDAYCHAYGFTGKASGNCGGEPPIAFVLAPGPWHRLDGMPWALGLADLVGGQVLAPVVGDEHDIAGYRYVWTGTRPDGTVTSDTSDNCGDWTKTDSVSTGWYGLPFRSTGSGWTKIDFQTCDNGAHLLCYDATPVPGVLPTWERPGSLVFETSLSGPGNLASWPGAGGLFAVLAADHVCQLLAAQASLARPDTFVAWLGDDLHASAVSRMTSPGPFKRVDGMEVAKSRADLLDGTLETSINVTEQGQYRDAEEVLTGTDPFGTTNADDCNEWESASASEFGVVGFNCDADGPWTYASPGNCSASAHLYCFSNLVIDFYDSFEKGLGKWTAHSP